MHTAQIRANFAQNQPSKRLLRKKRRKSHLMTLGRTLSVKAFPAAPRFRRKRRCSAKIEKANKDLAEVKYDFKCN